MKLPTKLVAVRKINSNISRSNFSTDDIENIAKSIIEVEGTINPIILKRTSSESYEVVDGHLEYYAAVRAREISPLKGEMIQAIILEPENEEALLRQVDLLRIQSSTTNGPDSQSIARDTKHQDLDSRFANLEKIFSLQFDELRKQIRVLETQVREGANSKVFIDEEEKDKIVAALVSKITEIIPRSRGGSSPGKKTVNELRGNPIYLNQASKSELTVVFGIGSVTAERIVERRESKGDFRTVEELAEIKNISLAKIRDNKWDECFVIS